MAVDQHRNGSGQSGLIMGDRLVLVDLNSTEILPAMIDIDNRREEPLSELFYVVQKLGR
jgi:hypothetical protein